jgi:chemotaxis protein MotA
MPGTRNSEGWNVMRRDYTALAGVGIAIAAVAGGFVLERGRIGDLASLNSAVIVVGGTIGSVLIGTPGFALARALRRCRNVLRRSVDARQTAADRIVRYAVLARRAGAGSLEPEAEALEDSFLRRALFLVVDGVNPQEVRRQLETEIASEEESADADARVFEQAGGNAPTIGIMGAVTGLIQVMRQLGNVDEVGRGIAAAFVSTLYGVALANLVLLPLAARIRLRARAEGHLNELVLEGATAIAEGLSLHLVRNRLHTYLSQRDAGKENRTMSTVPAPLAARRTA